MSTWHYIIRSLIHHGRMSAAVALGVAAATAVLTGALLVGDSVRGSLRDLTLERLGKVDVALVHQRFFREQLADQLAADPAVRQHASHVVGLILLSNGTVEQRVQQRTVRAGNVTVVGCPDTFWKLAHHEIPPETELGEGQIILNQPLADQLQVQAGDAVTLRVGAIEGIPADSPLGERDDLIRSLPQMKVVQILPAAGLGRFSLRADQNLPLNAYVSRATLQDLMEQPGKINAILVGDDVAQQGMDAAATQALQAALRPDLEDYGLKLKRVTLRHPQQPSGQLIYDYFSLSTDRMVLNPELEESLLDSLAEYDALPVLTYLANRIQPVDDQDSPGGIPYSMITAIDVGPDFPLRDIQGQPIDALADDQIVLHSWAAEDLQVAVGDQVRVEYFQPETTHGKAAESNAVFTVRAVTPLVSPSKNYLPDRRWQFDQQPALANDADLTPEVEGVTDAESIDDWEVPFSIDYDRLRPQDDAYWRRYATTPKAFVSLGAGYRLWSSRFGQATSIRVPAADVDQATLVQTIRDGLQPAEMGFAFQAVKQRQLDSSAGTTPFDLLFLALSFFIIASALILVALLFRLGIEQRASEVGTLLSVGFARRRAGRLLVAEGMLVAAFGGVLGVVVGIGYAWLMLTGLRLVWVQAVVTPFLSFHYRWLSLLLGYLLGVLISGITIYWSVRRMRRVAARRLLAGQAVDTAALFRGRQTMTTYAAGALLLVAALLAVMASQSGGQAQAGSFVGAGAAVLAALLLLAWQPLRQGGRLGAGPGALALVQLAFRSAGRNPGRSTMTLALIAVSSFLILAMSAFRLDPSLSGSGGFDLIGTSSQPVFADLTTAQGREDLLGSEARNWSDLQILPLRLRPGDDASCTNLYRPHQPQVLGVTPELVEHFQQPDVVSFSWAGSLDQPGGSAAEIEKKNPWQLLNTTTAAGDGVIPVVIDKNTAMYSMQYYGGVGGTIDFQYDDRTLTFRVVGFLSNSVLQGNLIIGEADFRKQFPDISGYRYFMIRSPEGQTAAVSDALEKALSDQGFDAQPSRRLLEDLLAVQNTYLRTFQSLGALGLLLGTFGVATVQVRNVLERRGELAVLRCCGFRRSRLATMVMLENVLLLCGGLGIGLLSALLAVLPHIWLGGAALPVIGPLIMLAVVLAAGVLSSLASVRSTLRAPLLRALRGE